MKKLCFVTAAILVTSAAFAQKTLAPDTVQPKPGIEKLDVEINVGFPIHWTNGIHTDQVNAANVIEDKSVTANTAIGFATNFNFNRKFGLSLYMDFSLGAKLAGFATPTSDSLGLSGLNAFFGPIMYLYNSSTLRIPLAVGVHMYYFGDDIWLPGLGTNGAWVNRHEFQFGPEFSLGMQYHFDNSIYMFSRTNVAIDFARTHLTKRSDGSVYTEEAHKDISPDWSVKPCLGIGIKF